MGFINRDIVIIYNSKTLKIENQYQIDAFEGHPEYDVIEKMLISAKCEFITVKTKDGHFVYNGKTGGQVHEIEYNNEQYHAYINNEEMIGVGYSQGSGGTRIVKYNVKGVMSTDIVSYDIHYYSLSFNNDGKQCIIDFENTLFYVDLHRKPEELVKFFEGYEYIKSKSITKDNISVIYAEESKVFLAYYKKTKLIFRKKIEMASYNKPLGVFATEDDHIIYVDNTNKVFIATEHTIMDISFENKVHFHDPALFYSYEKNEIWVQFLGNPYAINRFVFINTISAYSLVDQAYNSSDEQINSESCFVELLLTYEKCHRIAQFSFSEEDNSLFRMQKPIYFTDLPNSGIFSFTTMKATNDKNKEELCVMFQYSNQLKFYMLKSGKIRKHHESNYGKRNIIKFKNRMFFWEDNGRTIDRVECSIKKEERAYFYKAYDAKNIIKMCKKTHFHPGVECLVICDEQRFVKILSYDSVNKKFKVEKELFVGRDFASHDDLDIIETLQYSKGILYDNHISYLLQERGTEKGDMTLEVTSENFSGKTTKFPICTADYVLLQLEYNEKNPNQKSLEILMAPPLNSHKINSAGMKYSDHAPVEYFLHSDNNFVLRVTIVTPFKYYIALRSQTGYEHDKRTIEVQDAQSCKFEVSRNGRFFSLIYLKDAKYFSKVISFNKITTGSSSKNQPDTEDSKGESNTPSPDPEFLRKSTVKVIKKKSIVSSSTKIQLGASLIREIMYEYDVKLLADNNFILDKKQYLQWKVTNDGDIIGFSLREEKLFINEHEIFDKVRPKLAKYFKDILPERHCKYPVGFENIYIGESYILVRLPKMLF